MTGQILPAYQKYGQDGLANLSYYIYKEGDKWEIGKILFVVRLSFGDDNDALCIIPGEPNQQKPDGNSKLEWIPGKNRFKEYREAQEEILIRERFN